MYVLVCAKNFRYNSIDWFNFHNNSLMQDYCTHFSGNGTVLTQLSNVPKKLVRNEPRLVITSIFQESPLYLYAYNFSCFICPRLDISQMFDSFVQKNAIAPWPEKQSS